MEKEGSENKTHAMCKNSDNCLGSFGEWAIIKRLAFQIYIPRN